MAAAIMVGSIIYLQNSDQSGYLDTYGWVAAKPEFWNVAGTERIFVSTYKESDRGGGTTSWQVVSANGKQNGAPIHVGDRVHLRNMYPDAGYLDCCGWIEDLGPFNNDAYKGNVRCGVFTSGALNRDNGTGIWKIQVAGKTAGAPLYEGDAISLINAYPENKQPVDNQHAETGALVAFGKVAGNAVFDDFQDRQLLVFTSVNPDIQHAHGIWKVTLNPAYNQDTIDKSKDTTDKSWFDFYSPGLLKGRISTMESVSDVTRALLLVAFQAISGLDTENAKQRINGPDQQALLNTLPDAKLKQDTDSPTVIDYDFQFKQLLNLITLSKLLDLFAKKTLREQMSRLFLPMILPNQQNQTLPPLNVIRQCFRYIVTDHEIIQRATAQRQWNKEGDKYGLSKQAKDLLIIDKFAMKAVRPFQHLLKDHADQLAIITYFSGVTHIHRLPYTKQVMLIGVSYDRISPNNMLFDDKTTDPQTKPLTEKSFSSFELMAIPHEVGHYMYQHGMVGDQTFMQISEQFKNNPYYRWCEELFADVYGCIVAGPLCIFSIQAFLTSGDKELAWRDDDEHPTPILRSFILSEILRVLNTIDNRYSFVKITTKLDERWADTLTRLGYERVDTNTPRPARIYAQDETSTQIERIINVDRVLSSIRKIIKTFATLLLQSRSTLDLASGSDQQASLAIPWCNEDTEDKEPYARRMAVLTETITPSEATPQMASFTELATPNGAAPQIMNSPEAEMTMPSQVVQLLAALNTKLFEETATDIAKEAQARLHTYMAGWGDKGLLLASLNSTLLEEAAIDIAIDIATDAEACLRGYMAEWGDKGPSGFGGH